MSTQITWVSVVRRQKNWNYASACSGRSLFQGNLLVFFVCVFWACRQQNTQAVSTSNMWLPQRFTGGDDSYGVFVIYNRLYYVWGAFLFSWWNSGAIWRQRKRGMGASSAAYNLKDGAHFQSSSHSSSLLKSRWTGTPNWYALVAYLPNSVCLCFETLRLLIKRISFLAGELWALFSITKCQCAMGAHCC